MPCACDRDRRSSPAPLATKIETETETDNGLSLLAVLGLVIGSIFLFILFIGVIVYIRKNKAAIRPSKAKTVFVSNHERFP